MSELYRLVFRGEVAEGQHQAVVQKRLANVLKLSDEKVAQLFSGSSVVLRQSVDAKTAAQFQAAFKQAGARLRVQPIGERVVPVASPVAEPQAPAYEYGLRLLPVGSYILEVHERLPPVVSNIRITNLSLSAMDAPGPAISERTQTAPAQVNVEHLSIAEVGAPLGADHSADRAPERGFEFEFELAENGAWLQDTSTAAPLDRAAPNYTLAEPGARLSDAKSEDEPQPSPPDVSHLSLQQDDSQDNASQ